ncbi:MAG: hypothetical protein HY738_02700, partial [Bacteroidia bacterium]|nr:hypothetical protein [Bacteroidia bacterium]
RFVEKGGHLYNGQIIYSYWGYTSTTDIEGYFNILGEGDHNWTIRFDSNLNITFKEN